MRYDVADASPQKRRARASGADKGRVGAFCVSLLCIFRLSDTAGTIFAASSPTSLRAVKFGDAP